MTNRSPTLAKWPFIFADVALLAASGWAITQALPHRTTVAYVVTAIAIIAWIVGAFICIWPWLAEFKAQTQLLQNDSLADSLKQLERLEEVGSRVQAASANWQSVQDASSRVVQTAKEIEERIKTDSKDFMEFAERINADEKQNMRLEVEKLRRNEAEWLQVAARMLDHTFALTAAAVRSGQPNLGTQMTNFQNACRDAARRVGLVPFHPAPGDAFDDRAQQLEDPNARAEDGAIVTDVLATGFTFQGQLLRKALVRVRGGGVETGAPPQTEAAQPDVEQVQAEPSEAVEEQVVDEPVGEEPAPQPPVFKDEMSIEESRPIESSAANEPESLPPAQANEPLEPGASGSESEPTAEPAEEERPRRRRKADPQTSLPF